MDIEEFALGNSYVHRLDPRVKILAALFFSIVVALNNSVTACVMALCFPVVLIALARINLRRLLVRLVVVNGFVLFLWFFLPFTYKGEVIYAFGPLAVHREGVLYALLITLKSNVIVLTVVALLGTSPVFHIVHALSHLGVPDKLVHLFFFCYRYLHVVHDEYHRLVNAIKIRGFRPRTDLHTYRTYSYLVGALLVRSFDRSTRILAAMKCRGFKGRFYILDRHAMGRQDYFVGVSSVLFTLLVLVVR